MDFYTEVLLELMVAVGAALFFANAYALVRRRSDRRDAAKEAVARARPGSPVRKQVRVATTGKLDEAPVGRSVLYMVLGFVVAIAAIGALAA